MEAKLQSSFLAVPKPPQKLTPESMARYKGALREYDSKRLAAGVPAAVRRLIAAQENAQERENENPRTGHPS